VVSHISLVFREMWDTTTAGLRFSLRFTDAEGSVCLPFVIPSQTG
jgi:hypothetical protein